jgi:hypothetical protein
VNWVGGSETWEENLGRGEEMSVLIGTTVTAAVLFFVGLIVAAFSEGKDDEEVLTEDTDAEPDKMKEWVEEARTDFYDAVYDLKIIYWDMVKNEQYRGNQDIRKAAQQINELGEALSFMNEQAKTSLNDGDRAVIYRFYTNALKMLNPHLDKGQYVARILDFDTKKKYKEPEKDVARIQQTIDNMIARVKRDTISFKNSESTEINFNMRVLDTLVRDTEDSKIEQIDDSDILSLGPATDVEELTPWPTETETEARTRATTM